MLSLMEVYSMTDTTPLSPAAQAVMDACEWDGVGGSYKRAAAAALRAAALRAAADLVLPENYECFSGHLDWDLGMQARNDTVRENLLAIAAELEAQ